MEKYNSNEYLIIKITFNEYPIFTNLRYLPFIKWSVHKVGVLLKFAMTNDHYLF